MSQRGRPRHPDVLTPREQDVLALIHDGLTNEQIAERLNIGFETAKSHVAEILSKLDVATREEAAAWQPQTPRQRRKASRWAMVTAAFALMAAAGVGVVLLAWGVWRSGGNDGDEGPVGQIAYVSGAGDAYNVWVMNADGTDQRQLVTLDQPASVSGLRWSDDGQTLTFHMDVGGDAISHWEYTTDLAGNWTRQPASDFGDRYAQALKITVNGQLQGYTIAVSPDGSKAASYIGLQPTADGGAHGDSDTTSAWISSPDGNDGIKLTNDYGYTSPTDWSPDGQWVAMNCAPEFWQGEPVSIPPMPSPPQPMGVCLIHPDGSGLTRLADGCNATWSKNGQWLIFGRQGSLQLIRTDGSGQRTLADYGGGYDTYTWFKSRGTTLGSSIFMVC